MENAFYGILLCIYTHGESYKFGNPLRRATIMLILAGAIWFHTLSNACVNVSECVGIMTIRCTRCACAIPEYGIKTSTVYRDVPILSITL